MSPAASFDSQDPFPLRELESFSYEDAKEHAARVDRWLGLRTEETERAVRSALIDGETWGHLPVQAFNTPYLELRALLQLLRLQDGQTLVDLGCGYARLAFVMARHFPRSFFIGFELAEARVLEARRRLAEFAPQTSARILHQDLSDPNFSPPPAEFYFLYDFGKPAAIEKTLQDLRALAQRRPFQVIARGRGTRQALHLSHPWLTEVNPAHHFQHFSIYQAG